MIGLVYLFIFVLLGSLALVLQGWRLEIRRVAELEADNHRLRVKLGEQWPVPPPCGLQLPREGVDVGPTPPRYFANKPHPPLSATERSSHTLSE